MIDLSQTIAEQDAEIAGLQRVNAELVAEVKIIHIWARNPSNNILEDMDMIARKTEAALKAAGVL